jgi:hypothetical protein
MAASKRSERTCNGSEKQSGVSIKGGQANYYALHFKRWMMSFEL